MTIRKRNRLIIRIANVIAERDGAEAQAHHEADETAHWGLCCAHAYDAAADDTYRHLTNRRVYRAPSGRVYLPIGLPALQRMLAE